MYKISVPYLDDTYDFFITSHDLIYRVTRHTSSGESIDIGMDVVPTGAKRLLKEKLEELSE